MGLFLVGYCSSLSLVEIRWHESQHFDMKPSSFQTLGITLNWKSRSENVNVNLDVSFTLMNREKFTENKSFSMTSASFNQQDYSQGNTSFLKIADLLTHRPRFVDNNGEFIVELRLGNIKTTFIKKINVYSKIKDVSNGNDETPLDLDDVEIISEDFTFGTFNWCLVLKPLPKLITSSWASAAATVVAASKRNALKQSKNSPFFKSENYSNDNLGVVVRMRRNPSQSGSVNDQLARICYKVL